MFVAVGYNDDKPDVPIIASSTDGISWTKNTFATPYKWDYKVSKVFFGGGKFILSGLAMSASNGAQVLCVSTDSISWDWQFTNVQGSGTIPSFAYGKNGQGTNIWVIAFGNRISSYSDRGPNMGSWRSAIFQIPSDNPGVRARSKETSDNSINGVFFEGGRFIAFDRAGRCLSSSDGYLWQTNEGNTAISGKPITSMISGDGTWIGVGPDNTIGWAFDGITWTASDSKAELRGGNFTGVAYGSGMFVAVNNRGKIIYSPDGFEWTQVSSSTFGDTNIREVAYGNGRFVAIGDNGRIAYSNKVE